MKFSANFKIDNFKYFLDCLNCLNKLSKEVYKNSTNILKITKEKVNFIIKTNGLLDSYFEINNNELFIEPVILNETLTIEIDINSLYDSLNSSIKSENIKVYIWDEEYLYVKYIDSVYNTINIILKIPIVVIYNNYVNLPNIPYTNYNINLSKLQTISFLLNSLNKIGNTIIEFNIRNISILNENVNSCKLQLSSIGSIVNVESIFNNLQIFTTKHYQNNTQSQKEVTPNSYNPIDSDSQNALVKIFLNVNILNILLKSIIESNLYNKNRSLIILTIPDDNEDKYIYIIISMIQLESCQMIFIVPNIREDE
ncbi:hypothetical protein TpMuguga_04g02555 [Theileria parva strain Muguga]|uniref:uncharacterized protein n=1 Tax=Theileria parva strain Muguga TaxID=333668 RepID=UPI001C6208A1|nr:uncharacterized protein TpMuguga_04g02555 [Theileria parva strain Muguga]KAF5153177.1 hypothetical protein TpMuguga_04g02555 [Theileria parva strain Muguga]